MCNPKSGQENYLFNYPDIPQAYNSVINCQSSYHTGIITPSPDLSCDTCGMTDTPQGILSLKTSVF